MFQGLIGLCFALKVEKFAEKIERTGHLLVESFCRVLGDFMVNLQMGTVTSQMCLCTKWQSGYNRTQTNLM